MELLKRLVLIVIDGLDGSGKSTQANRLCTFFQSQGKTVCIRFHPSNDNFLGVKARQFLYSKGRSGHLGAALFYMLDVLRSIMLYTWQKYDYLIFVRYLMGTAYLPSPLHKIAYYLFALFVPKSDLMLFLDVRPEEANRRIQETRGKLEMFEDLEELKQTRCKALSLAFIGKWTIMNANKSARILEEEIVTTLTRRDRNIGITYLKNKGR